MLVYKAAYYFDESAGDNGWVVGEVLDYPGAVSQGRDLADARRMLGAALVDMAESDVIDGRPLPNPDPSRSDSDADIQEPIYLLLNAASAIRILPEEIPA
jgi:predicted RNase H-like HicB family nuclease